jgi:hypothetical protein
MRKNHLEDLDVGGADIIKIDLYEGVGRYGLD